MSSNAVTNDRLRIVSLIPSATEIVDCLGYGQYLVGRSHECDFPASVRNLPICTEPKFDPHGTSREIHNRVTDLLTSALSVYRVNTELLAELAPTHIITQAQCEVCAVSLSDVEQAANALVFEKAPATQSLQTQPLQIVSLQPNHLSDVWEDIQRVDTTLSSGSNGTASSVIESLQQRLRAITSTPPNFSIPPTVACIEWSDPLMAAGNWVPELVKLAGGNDCFGIAGTHSAWMSWEDLSAANPDIIIVMPCGYDLATTRQATEEMSAQAAWSQLNAVKNNQVYLTDGNQYFNRPGPRLVDSGEILAEIIQGKPVNAQRASIGWEKF